MLPGRDRTKPMVLLIWLIGMAVAVAPIGSASPLRRLGRALPDDTLIEALSRAALSDAMDLLAGAAERSLDRPQLLEALLQSGVDGSRYTGELLAAFYLEDAFFETDGSLRAVQVPQASLRLLTLHYPTLASASLKAVYFRICARYRWPPPAAVLMHAGADLLRDLRVAGGTLDATRRRLAWNYLNATTLRPDPSLARLVDDIRRASRERDLVVHARRVAMAMFD